MFGRLHKENAEESAEDSDERAQADVDEFVLTKNETGRTHQSAQENAETEPAKGIEVKPQRVCTKRTDHAACRRRMGAYLDPVVECGADDLQRQSSHDDCQCEMWHMEHHHQIQKSDVACYRKKIGDVSIDTPTQMMARPTIEAAIDVDGQSGEQHCEKINHQQNDQFIAQGKLVQITEQKKRYKGHNGRIERRKNQRNYLRCQDEYAIVHFRSCVNSCVGHSWEFPEARDISLLCGAKWGGLFLPLA